MTKPYDSADYLKTPEAVAAYLEDVLEDNDPALIAHALGVAARAHGMSAIAKKTNPSRESLYRTLSAEGNPELETLIKVLTELGLRLSVEPAADSVVSTPKREATVASKALRTGKATPAQIRSMGGRMKSALVASAAAKRKKKR